MVTILDPQLHVEPVSGEPALRQVRVSYVLDVQEGDPVHGREVTERATLRATDRHDAPAPPQPLEVVIAQSSFLAEPGRHDRELQATMNRADLDVEEDWWQTRNDGQTVPIAELLDHLVADLELISGDTLVAQASTPVVTGSWGVLGES